MEKLFKDSITKLRILKRIANEDRTHKCTTRRPSFDCAEIMNGLTCPLPINDNMTSLEKVNHRLLKSIIIHHTWKCTKRPAKGKQRMNKTFLETNKKFHWKANV